MVSEPPTTFRALDGDARKMDAECGRLLGSISTLVLQSADVEYF